MKKSFFILTLSVLSIVSVLANTEPANAASSSGSSSDVKVTIQVVPPLSAADVNMEAGIWKKTTQPVVLSLSEPTYLSPSVQYGIKATITSGSHKGMVCWDIYTFAPNKAFTLTLHMINNNTACEIAIREQ